MKFALSISSLALISVAVAGCHSDESSRPGPVETVQARVVASSQEQVPVLIKSTGTLHAHESATLSAQVMGRVQQVLVRAGDTVRAGQTLVILDDRTLQSAADQAESAVKAAESQQIAAQQNADLAASTLARYKQLQAEKSVSPQEMDEVTRRAQAAAAQVDALKAQANAMKAQQSGAHTMLAYTRITAPFAGVVTARMVDPGALASPGVPLIQIDSTGPLQLQTTVDESAIGIVHTGMKVTVSVDGASANGYSGSIAEIVPAADPSSHSFLVKINMPAAKELRAGMYANTGFQNGTKGAVLVPRTAIIQRGSLSCAYVLDANNIAQLRYATLGNTFGDKVDVLSGIAPVEKLVDDPGDRDLAGKRIEVQP